MIQSKCWKEKLAIKNILSKFSFRNKGEKNFPIKTKAEVAYHD